MSGGIVLPGGDRNQQVLKRMADAAVREALDSGVAVPFHDVESTTTYGPLDPEVGRDGKFIVLIRWQALAPMFYGATHSAERKKAAWDCEQTGIYLPAYAVDRAGAIWTGVGPFRPFDEGTATVRVSVDGELLEYPISVRRDLLVERIPPIRQAETVRTRFEPWMALKAADVPQLQAWLQAWLDGPAGPDQETESVAVWLENAIHQYVQELRRQTCAAAKEPCSNGMVMRQGRPNLCGAPDCLRRACWALYGPASSSEDSDQAAVAGESEAEPESPPESSTD